MCGDGDLFCSHKEKWKPREEEKSLPKSKLQNHTAWGWGVGWGQRCSSINSDANSTVHLIGSRNTQSSDMSCTIHGWVLDWTYWELRDSWVQAYSEPSPHSSMLWADVVHQQSGAICNHRLSTLKSWTKSNPFYLNVWEKLPRRGWSRQHSDPISTVMFASTSFVCMIIG